MCIRDRTYTDEAIEACVKLTDRYMSERFLPDKAIDALDEAGSRVHITNIDVPKQILDLERQLEEVRELKNSVVKRQKYEEAAKLRDDEKKLEKELAIAPVSYTHLDVYKRQVLPIGRVLASSKRTNLPDLTAIKT